MFLYHARSLASGWWFDLGRGCIICYTRLTVESRFSIDAINVLMHVIILHGSMRAAEAGE
jgi:hypothetical protein